MRWFSGFPCRLLRTNWVHKSILTLPYEPSNSNGGFAASPATPTTARPLPRHHTSRETTPGRTPSAVRSSEGSRVHAGTSVARGGGPGITAPRRQRRCATLPRCRNSRIRGLSVDRRVNFRLLLLQQEWYFPSGVAWMPPKGGMPMSVYEPTRLRDAGERRLPSAVQALPSVPKVFFRTRADHFQSSSSAAPARIVSGPRSGPARVLATSSESDHPLTAGRRGVPA